MSKPLSRRAILGVIVLIVGIVVLIGGGYQLYHHLGGRPQSPAQVKKEIARYLKEKAGRKNFASVVPAGLTNDVALQRNRRPGRSDSRTARRSDSRSNEGNDRGGRRREGRGEQPPPLAATKDFRGRLETAANYETIYGVIGEELWMCDQLLARGNPQETQLALLIAMEASDAAINKAVDSWLGARICEAYLWPGLESAEASDIRGLNSDTLIQVSDDAFQGAGETNNIIRNYKLLLGKGGGVRRADMARQRLAGLYEEMGDYKSALQYLSQMQNTNNGWVQRRIATLRSRSDGKTVGR